MSSQFEREQFNITLLGLSANLGMGLFKMIGGSFFHSQALKADGFHSLADSITDLTAMGTLYLDSVNLLQTKSVPVKFEDVGAIAIASMVLAGGTALGKEALAQDGGSSELASAHAVWLCFASIIVKEFLYSKTMEVAQRIDSRALSASAAHHRLDSFTSIFALISIVAGYLYPNTRLIDRICGGLLAIFVLKESVGIIIGSGIETGNTGRVISLSIITITVFFFLAQLAQFSAPIEAGRPTVPSPISKETEHIAPRENVWADLSNLEVVAILEFFHSSALGLNLTAAINATLWDDFVVGTEVIRPSKNDALSYMSGASENPPPRYGKLAIHRGTESEVYWDEYSVGPLPISHKTRIEPFEYHHRADLEHARNLIPDAKSFKEWPYMIAQEISDITQDLLNATINFDGQSDPDGLELSFRDPWIEDGHIIRDPKNWKVLKWYYNGELYSSTEEFRAAWETPGFEKAPINYDGEWTRIEDFSSEYPERDDPAPIMVHPGKSRYRLDRDSQYVSWMGFTFYWAFSQASGVTLFDVRFKGERILYELGLQEAMSLYAGNDPVQGALAYFDSFFGMGRAMFELVPGADLLHVSHHLSYTNHDIAFEIGYDCPAYASFMDTTIYDAERTQRRRNTICLFEYTSDYPLQRHSTSFYVTVSKNNYLILRTTAVVGNYDYTVDYIFYLDGSIEIKVRASGYIQGAYFMPDESREYGFRVHDAFATSMHDHVINFKADLDILESRNTLMKIDIEPKVKSFSWLEGKSMNTMGLTKSSIKKESGLDWPANSASMYVVTKNGSDNAWGETRGYRIMPGSGMGTPVHSIPEESEPLGKSALWATKALWVTKQKDDEVRSAMSYGLTWDHIMSRIRGDIPNTLQHTSASSVILAPLNFHDRDASRKSSQGVRVDFASQNDGRAKTQFFGHHYEELHLEDMDFLPNLASYGTEEHQVRKFPYTEDMLSI
ncbi:membrane copper amine oxidase [Penicillium chermesinum]|nr:membrane copper amine oxidase [Penicillium chermesinum]